MRDRIALVLGSDIVGSAVGHALCVSGWDVVLIDDIDPPGPWRGMSFVNAWYLGTAELDGVGACFCASVKSIPAVLDRKDLIAATSWSWQGVATALAPDALIDTRPAMGAAPANVRGRAPAGLLIVQCSPADAAGACADVVIDTRQIANALAGERSERSLRAPRSGRMRSQFRIGDAVAAGEPVGDVNGAPLLAPASGVLRGLCARGARVAADQVVVEVDPAGDAAACYGIDPWAARVAADVADALAHAGVGGPHAPRTLAVHEPM